MTGAMTGGLGTRSAAEFERTCRAQDAFELALGEDYGNFMERRMVVTEMAWDGEPQAVAELEGMEARLTRAEQVRNQIEAAPLRGEG